MAKLVLTLLLLLISAVSPSRKIEGNRIISSDPRLVIDVTSGLKFIGRFEGDIRDAAHYERIVFADADANGNIHRLWIAQFESMLPGHRGSYDSKMNNRVQIGPLAFDQQVGRYSFSRSIASKPGGEAEKTKQFLVGRGLVLDDDLTVARFETHTDAQNRSELLIFYWEHGGDLNTFAEKAKGTFAIHMR